MKTIIYYGKGECPECGERVNIECQAIQVDGPTAWEECVCEVCGCEYTNVFEIAYSEITEE